MASHNSNNEKKLHKGIAESIGIIVRYSKNEDFRRKCFNALNVDSTHKLELAVRDHLEHITRHPKRLQTSTQESILNNTQHKDQAEPVCEDKRDERKNQEPNLSSSTPHKANIFKSADGSGSWLKAAKEQSQRSAQKQGRFTPLSENTRYFRGVENLSTPNRSLQFQNFLPRDNTRDYHSNSYSYQRLATPLSESRLRFRSDSDIEPTFRPSSAPALRNFQLSDTPVASQPFGFLTEEFGKDEGVEAVRKILF